LSDNESDLSKIISKVSPSVVGIIGNIAQEGKDISTYGDSLIFGSGVIYKANGYIITNAHVVKNMENIAVVLYNGRSYKAVLKAIDEKFDLALLKIYKGGLTPATFGTMKDVIVGDPVIAMGTPLSFSLRNSATKGIISGINRSVQGDYRFIQSDAAINGGNSGGPLVNKDGKVIGINSVKYTGYGIEGLSFSIPVDTVMYVLDHFERFGKVRTPYIGAEFVEGIAAKYGLPTNEGLTITKITKGSPAERAGLKVDDIAVTVNGIKITTIVDYNEEMKKYLPGSKITIGVDRDGKIVKLGVTCGEKQDKK